MTVLAFRHARKSNAVSNLHGSISRSMWQGLWPDRPTEAVPIGHITNGVHMPSWVAPQMRLLYDRYLGSGWAEHASEPAVWSRIQAVSDEELWETHLALKARLVDYVRRGGAAQAKARGDTPDEVAQARRALSMDTLTIGFARRFATYKRADLVLRDLERIAQVVNDSQRPVQFVFAGKAHPRDVPGKEVLQKVALLTKDQRFAGKLVFIEDYDMNTCRHLVQGVDVWLNTPRRPLEASGTSGQKVVVNGGLNFSVIDGWWAEAYDGANGFAIGHGATHVSADVQDARDAEDLWQALVGEVIPLYYRRDANGVPLEWIRRVKRSIGTLAWRFHADRMVLDYVRESYIPCAGGTSCTMP